MSRELDRAVAEALGFRADGYRSMNTGDRLWWRLVDPGEVADRLGYHRAEATEAAAWELCPAFSTDPTACDRYVLPWLQGRGWLELRWPAPAQQWQACWAADYRGHWDAWGFSNTSWMDAACRLVLAVLKDVGGGEEAKADPADVGGPEADAKRFQHEEDNRNQA